MDSGQPVGQPVGVMPQPATRSKTLLFATLVSATGALACARTQTVTPKPNRAFLDEPGPLAERWRLPARIFDTASQSEVTEAELVDRLLDARVVYVAEKHASPHDHAVQLSVIHALFTRDASLGIGMEMFKRPFQKWVTDYIEGRITEAELRRQTEWEARWGFDFALYRPILRYARTHRIPVYALNARDEITRAVARGGLGALSPVDRDTVPELDLDDPLHRSYLEGIFDSHGMGKTAHGEMTFENFYTAQLIWDETMAYEVAAELGKPSAPRRIVVLAGSGHIRHGFGIPNRAARRGATPHLTIYPFVGGADEATAAVDDQVADFVWVMSTRARES